MNLEKNILATIVTYNPDIDILSKNILSLKENVDGLIVVDNNSDNIEQIDQALQDHFYNKCHCLVRNNVNKGIGHALNQSLYYANQHGYTWMLTLDQDSICSVGYIAEMQKHIDGNVGIICPAQCVDIGWAKLNDVDNALNKIVCNIKRIVIKCCYDKNIYLPITSGALMNVDALNHVGGYDEDMFIDGIDFDVDLKLQKVGCTIVECDTATLHHSLGYPQQKTFMGVSITASGHSPKRIYYMNRNAWRLLRRYLSFAPRWCIGNIVRSIVYAVKNAIVLGKYKAYGIALLRGVYDGVTGKG